MLSGGRSVFLKSPLCLMNAFWRQASSNIIVVLSKRDCEKENELDAHVQIPKIPHMASMCF